MSELDIPAMNFDGGILSPGLSDITGLGEQSQGKVRDIYPIKEGKRLMVTTDRQSAFDRVVGAIPCKGAVLNMLSAYWFDQTAGIVPNHMLAIPHPNVIIAKEAFVTLPVEIIVRGYMAKSSSSTSIYRHYSQGERVIYGINFPDGLQANQKFDQPIITPTTKAAYGEHDQELTSNQARRMIDERFGTGMWYEAQKAALNLFEFAQGHLDERGIILADTKFEFGVDENGRLMVIDELFTPDSSRFWLADSYQERFEHGLSPENFDKEFLRAWLAEQGFKGEGPVPKLPSEMKQRMSDLYTGIYSMVTDDRIEPSNEEQIIHAVSTYPSS